MLSERKKRAFYEFNKNSERPALIENEDNNGMMFGFTDNYVKIKIPYDSSYINTIQTVSLKELDRDLIFKTDLKITSKQELI